MGDVLLGAVTVVLVAGTGLAVAANLRLPDLPRLILGAYVVGFAEVVGLTLVLSAFQAVGRPAILVAVAFLFVVSAAYWLVIGAPRPPLAAGDRLRALKRSSILLVLAVATGLALLYVAALIVGTPPNNYDALTYHLARAAFWSQGDSVGYIANAYDERLNAHPPNAEIALTFILEVGRHERLAGLVQFTAALASAAGVYAIARKLSLARREAAFGGLLFLMLPIVLLQASTTQNDLVVASLLIAATVFLLGDSSRECALAALATALAIGTKVPAAYALPILIAVALVASPTTQRVERTVALFAGAAVGSYWYVANLVRSGHPLGDLPDASATAASLDAVLQPKENFLGAYARLMDALDLSGAQGPDVLIYGLVAALVVVVLLLRTTDRSGQVFPALITGVLVLTPLVLLPVNLFLWSVFVALDGPDDLGRLPFFWSWRKTISSDTISWFGPLGFLLVVGFGVATLILVRRRFLPPVALVLAFAPLVWLVLVSVTLAYDVTQGRFFMFPVAASASLWGLVLRTERYAIAVMAIAMTSATLSLVGSYEKPSGLSLLKRDDSAAVWTMERWDVQSIPGEAPVSSLRFLAELPTHASVALALGYNDFGYPAFGPSLERRVELIPFGSDARRSGAEWLLANPQRAPEIDRRCWRVNRVLAEGWTGFKRNVDACRP